jgi:hypothetical protein
MDTVSKVAPIMEAMDEIQRLYAVKDEAEVLAFLQDHPTLVPLLLEAAPQLQKYFPGARLSVERIADPEEPIEQLFVGAATDLPLEQALERLGQFDRDWWLENGIRARGKLCIDVGS